MLKIEVDDEKITTARMYGLRLGSICISKSGTIRCIKKIIEERVLTYESQAARDIFGREDTSTLIGRNQKLSCSDKNKAVALGMSGYVVVAFENEIVSGDEIDIDVVEPPNQNCSDIKIPYVLSGIDKKGTKKIICKGDSNQKCKVK